MIGLTTQLAVGVQSYINSGIHIKNISNNKIEIYSSNRVYPGFILVLGD